MSYVDYLGCYGYLEARLYNINGEVVGHMISKKSKVLGGSSTYVTYAPVPNEENIYRAIDEECYYER